MSYLNISKKNLGALFVTYISMLFEGAINVLMIVSMDYLISRYNVDRQAISVLITLKSLGTFLTVYISGGVSDKIGKRKVIFTGLIFFMVFLIGMVLTSNYTVALVLSLLAGIGHGLMDAPSIAILVDIFAEKNGPAMSFVQVFFGLGGLICSSLATMFVKYNINLLKLNFVMMIIGLILALIILKSQFPDDEKIKTQTNMNKTFKKLSENSIVKSAFLLAVAAMSFSAANAIVITWLPTYSEVVLGMTQEKSILQLSQYQTGNIIGAIFFAWLLTQFPAEKLQVVNASIAIISLTAFMYINTNIPLLFISGLVMGVMFSLSLNIIGKIYKNESGRAIGFIGMVAMMSTMITTFITGRLVMNTGVAFVFSTVVWVLLIGLLASYGFGRKIKKNENKKEIL